jgi:adenylate cyclase
MVSPIERRLAAILAADIVGFSSQMEADEAGTLELLRHCRKSLIDPGLKKHQGRLIKTMGDGVLLEFSSVVQAVKFAIEFQQGVSKFNESSDLPEVLYRIGINLGDVMIEDGDVFGDGVNVAARLEPLAAPGGIVVSAAVVDQVRDPNVARFEEIGERRLKNIARDVRLFRVSTGVEKKLDAALPKPVVDDSPSIAVLPFECMSSGPDDEFLADGLTEDILTGLSRFKELFVISRTSAFAYKGRKLNLQEIAADLGVRYILEGSVRRAGARVRVTAQLIDALGGDRHIWADRYDRQIEDIFDLQDELTSSIVATLPGRIEAAVQERTSRKKPDNMAAYELVLAGKLLHHRSNREANTMALEFLGRAVELEPEYAHAWAWRACTLGQAYTYGWIAEGDSASAMWARAGEYLGRAQSLDDEDSDVHRLYAAVGIATNDFDLAKRHQERALQLNPNDDLIVVQQGELHTWTGSPREGVEWIKKAMKLNPYHPERYWGHLGRAYFVSREYGEAISCFRKLSKVDETVHACLAAALGAEGELTGAQRHGEEILRSNHDFSISKYLNTLHYTLPEDIEHHRKGLLAAGLSD